MAIDRLWHEADMGNWDQNQIKNPKSLEKFEKEIENYGAQMQQWREHLNADAEADLAGWMEMTKEILNQIDYAYKYYNGFVSFLFESRRINYQVENKILEPSAASNISQYPFRLLPFYGVSTGPYKAIGSSLEDYYLLNPNEIEKRQKEHILKTAEKYKALALNFKKAELTQFNSIIEKLLSQNNLKMSSGLNDLNKVAAVEQVYVATTGAWEDTSGYSDAFQDLAHQLKKELGNPQPVMHPLAGYTQAFAAYSTAQVTAEAADYSKWVMHKFYKLNYKFNKEADLMFYKIICGAEQGSLLKTNLWGANIFAPSFAPPTLLKPNHDRREFCNSFRDTTCIPQT